MRWFFFDLWRNLWETLRIASCDGGFSWISWSSISISISLNFWINDSSSSFSRKSWAIVYSLSSSMFSTWQSKSFYFKIEFNYALLNTFWSIASKISIAQGAWLNTILKESDFDCQVGTSMKTKSWRLLMIFLRKKKRSGWYKRWMRWKSKERIRKFKKFPKARVCDNLSRTNLQRKEHNFHQNTFKIKKCPSTVDYFVKSVV